MCPHSPLLPSRECFQRGLGREWIYQLTVLVANHFNDVLAFHQIAAEAPDYRTACEPDRQSGYSCRSGAQAGRRSGLAWLLRGFLRPVSGSAETAASRAAGKSCLWDAEAASTWPSCGESAVSRHSVPPPPPEHRRAGRKLRVTRARPHAERVPGERGRPLPTGKPGSEIWSLSLQERPATHEGGTARLRLERPVHGGPGTRS